MKPQKEKTLVLLKPDAVQRSLIGEIISRLWDVSLPDIAAVVAEASPKRDNSP